MTISERNRMVQLEARVKSLEDAFNILLKERAPDLETMPVIVHIKNEIQGIKMRAGRKLD